MGRKLCAIGPACVCAFLVCVKPGLCQTTAGTEAATATIADIGGTTIIAGVRLWANQWDVSSAQRIPVVPNPANPTVVVLQDVSVKTLSTTEYVPIPLIGLRYENFLALATFFPRTGYNSQNPALGTVDRDEYDVTLGYAVAPSLVVSVGYKTAYQSKVSGQVSPSSAKVNGILIGASGSAPLAEKLSLYGSLAYGFARQKSDFVDAAGQTKYNGNYQIGEIGLSYLLYEGSEKQGLKNVLATFGYRAQSYTVESVALGTFAPGPPPVLLEVNYQNIRTTTNGFVFGIVGAF